MHKGLCNIPSVPAAVTPIPETHTHVRFHSLMKCRYVRRLWIPSKIFQRCSFNHDSWASKPLSSSQSDVMPCEDITKTVRSESDIFMGRKKVLCLIIHRGNFKDDD